MTPEPTIAKVHQTTEERNLRPTTPPSCRSARHRTRAAAIWLALLLGAQALAGCSLPAAAPPSRVTTGDRSPGELRVQLWFGAEADLDLYVTGPRLETVYFANTPTRIGGALEADIRCDETRTPRVETIRFPAAPAGRYRVGIDFPERCTLTASAAPYRVSIDGDGLDSETTGEIAFGRFESRALEFDYDPAR